MTTEKPACYNRPAYRDRVVVQEGWAPTHDGFSRIPIMKSIPDQMSKGCQQWGPLGCAKIGNWNCDGCKWKPE